MNILSSISTGTAVAACLWCVLFGCDSVDEPVSDQSTPTATMSEPAPKAPAVLAVVNDREINHAEVEHRLDRIGELYRHSRRPFDDTTRAEKREQVLQRLIDRELLREHIAHRDVDISSQVVEEQLQERINSEFGSTEAFRRFLDAEEMSTRDFRNRLREELAIKKLLTEQTDPKEIDDDQLRDHYDRIANRRPADHRIQAATVSLRLPDPKNDEDRSQAREALEKALGELESPRDLYDLTTALPEEVETRVYDLRWLERRQLHSAATEILFDDDINSTGLAPIVDTSLGFEVYWIHDRREAGTRKFDEVEDLLRDRAHRSRLEEQRRELLRDLRRQADISINRSQVASPATP